MSTNYTADELVQLASEIDDLAAALPVETPGPAGQEYFRWCQALGGTATNLRLMAVQTYLTDAEEPLSAIITATREANKAVQRIKNVKKAIELIGDIVLLGSVIWLQKWSLVLPTLKELRKDVKAA
jgi:hypothetical protein